MKMSSNLLIYDRLIVDGAVRKMAEEKDRLLVDVASVFVDAALEKKLSYTQMRAALDIAHEILRNCPLTIPAD